MSTYRFEAMLDPRSIAVVGAGERDGSVGRAVLDAIRAGGFEGAVLPVNRNHETIDGARCYPSLADLPEPADLVVIATPPHAVAGIVETAARTGSAAAVVMSTRIDRDAIGAARAVAREHGLRLIGPDSTGLSIPGNKLNATLLARPPKRGDIALVTQMGTVASSIAEWAGRHDLGFSGIMTLGGSTDVDLADCLDWFAADIHTRAILLSLGEITDARKFLSAARAAARAKPVLVLRTGRRSAARAADGHAPATHTGALARPDAVYQAAFRRAGLLSVNDLDGMFAAVEVLARQRPFPGKRLMIVANGEGLAALAADRLADRGGVFAQPSQPEAPSPSDPPPEGEEQADEPAASCSLPVANPLDLGADAVPAAYEHALLPLLKDRDSDAVLALHVPTARAAAEPVAEAIARATAEARKGTTRKKPILAVSIGEDPAAAEVFAKAKIPLFATDADAVEGFLHLVRYREAQDDLMATPDSLPRDFSPDAEAARAVIATALAQGRAWLDPPAVEALLGAYDIPLMPSVMVPDPESACEAAWPLIAAGETVALKLVSPDIVHKSDVGGVKLNLASEADVREAALAILARTRALRPDARITGFAVQAMVPRGTERELIVGLAEDPVFGPVVVFGRGGSAVEVIDDRSLGLPPLDLRLATEQIFRTRVSRRLAAYRDVPAADIRAIALVLVKLAQMAADLPELRELDINPLLAGAHGVLGVDARVRIEAPRASPVAIPPSVTSQQDQAPATGDDAPSVDAPKAAGEVAEVALQPPPMFHVKHRPSRLAIRPYPVEWERDMVLNGRAILVRPVRPDDEALFAAFFRHVSPNDIRLRFHTPVKDFSHVFLARLTQLDYARNIAFVALDTTTDDIDEKMLGSVRLHADANHLSGEFAIMIRADLRGSGLGEALMRMMIHWARSEGIERIEGSVLVENQAMLAVCRRLGFTVRIDPENPSVSKVGKSTLEPVD